MVVIRGDEELSYLIYLYYFLIFVFKSCYFAAAFATAADYFHCRFRSLVVCSALATDQQSLLYKREENREEKETRER